MSNNWPPAYDLQPFLIPEKYPNTASHQARGCSAEEGFIQGGYRDKTFFQGIDICISFTPLFSCCRTSQ